MNFNLKNLSILQKITYLVAAWFLFILATYTLILTKNSHTKRDALPAELSRGMKQKLAIACGLLHSPKAAERLAVIFTGRIGPAVYCISAAAAAPLAGRAFAKVAFADQPTEEALLALLPA